MIVWNKKPAADAHADRAPLRDDVTGDELAPRSQPGYYPGFSTLRQQHFWDAATRELVLERVNNVPTIRFFSAAEALTMQAVIDRILPQDDRFGSSRVPILPFLDQRLFMNHIEGYRYDDMPPDQEAYKLAVYAIETMAEELHRRDFPALSTIEQEMILQSLHDGEPRAAKALWKKMNLKRFWTMLVSDCCAVYYAHPYAWDEIGFGGPAYPRGYMRLEEGEAEPWEVEELRYDWSAPSDTVSDTVSSVHEQKTPPAERAGAL